MSSFWFFVGIISVFCPCYCALHAFSPGDIIIGGLFPLHMHTNRSTTNGCSGFDFKIFLGTQVMIYAIREINQHTPRLLPNFTIGYEIYDTCGNVSFAIRAALQLLKNQSDPQSCVVPTSIHTAFPEPKAKAVIGEQSSEISIAVARVTALSSVAQISYAATSELLSSKLKFPTFLRTIASDKHQTKAIARMMKEFNCKTVAIVGSDDEYGKYGSERLEHIFIEMKDICIEFTDILPDYFSQNNSKTHTRLANLVSKINKSTAEAIILFTKASNVAIIMEAAIKHNLNRMWVASDAWSTSTTISALPGIQMAGEVYGFISKRNEVPGFKDDVLSLFNGTNNTILQHYLTQYPLCSNQSNEETESNCSLINSQNASTRCLEPSCLATFVNQALSYNIYLAVKVVAEGLRRLLKCDNHHCNRSATFTALELLMEIKKVNFTVNTTHIFFDQNGDPYLGYDIVYWNMTASKQRARIETIGEYQPDEKFKVPIDLLRKLHNVTTTVYNCSKTCISGQELKRQGDQCCTYCVLCVEGHFSAGNGEMCKYCGQHKYSSPERDKCLNKTLEFLDWSDPFNIILSTLEIFGIIVTIVFAILFTVYHNTPIVKAVGGYLCFLELVSLLFCFCLSFSFTGKPTKYSCMLGLPLFGIAFSLCIACILANLLQILVGFNFDMELGSWMKKLNQRLAVVTILPGIQLALCVLWLYFYPPYSHTSISSKTILLYCEKGSHRFFIAMLSYNAFLGIICFLFAFKGKQLPDLYKNASLITIGMVLFLFIWMLFIPIYISMVGKYKHAIEGLAIVISSYSILSFHLAPKCYMMVFRKEINNENTITEYIRKHYNQKDLPVGKS